MFINLSTPNPLVSRSSISKHVEGGRADLLILRLHLIQSKLLRRVKRGLFSLLSLFFFFLREKSSQDQCLRSMVSLVGCIFFFTEMLKFIILSKEKNVGSYIFVVWRKVVYRLLLTSPTYSLRIPWLKLISPFAEILGFPSAELGIMQKRNSLFCR